MSAPLPSVAATKSLLLQLTARSAPTLRQTQRKPPLRLGPTCDNGSAGRYFQARERRRAMPAMDEDDRPKKKISHEIGQELALLSIGELEERIALLKDEITRLQAAIASKQGSRSVADQFFKK
jgi:uncharacterized small protein (DUF1192 family)